MFQIKRVYDSVNKADGRRILIDRLWPRGIKKEDLNADEWIKEVAPSTDLRKWFDHREDRWQEFQQRYREELDNSEAWKPILEAGDSGDVTLLYSARDTEHNQAVVLLNYLKDHAKSSKT